MERNNTDEVQKIKVVGEKRIIDCPHCHEAIMVIFNTEIIETLTPEQIAQRDKREPLDWRSLVSPEQVEFIEDMKEKGLFEAFEQAVRRAKRGNIPRYLEKFFLQVLKSARATVAPRFVLDHFMNEFPRTRIECWSGEGVGIILADGCIRHFIPTELLLGRGIKSSKGGNKARLSIDQDEFAEWNKTRLGYIAGRGLMFKEMQKKSAGEVGWPRL